MITLGFSRWLQEQLGKSLVHDWSGRSRLSSLETSIKRTPCCKWRLLTPRLHWILRRNCHLLSPCLKSNLPSWTALVRTLRIWRVGRGWQQKNLTLSPLSTSILCWKKLLKLPLVWSRLPQVLHWKRLRPQPHLMEPKRTRRNPQPQWTRRMKRFCQPFRQSRIGGTKLFF